MKVKIKGITGDVLKMEATVEEYATVDGKKLMICGYYVSIIDNEGVEITFKNISPLDIEYVGV